MPELEEERFQSLVAVPLRGKRGDAIGAITLAHGGAARVHRRRSRVPRRERIARRGRDRERAALRRDAAARRASSSSSPSSRRRSPRPRRSRCSVRSSWRGARQLLGAEAVPPLPERRGGRPAALPLCGIRRGPTAPAAIGLGELGPELGRRRPRRVASPSRSSPATSCSALLVADGTRELDLARTVANQAAVGDQEDPGARAADREEPDQGLLRGARRAPSRRGDSRAARRASAATSRAPHLVLAAVRVDDALEQRVASLARGTLIDRRDESLRALVPVGARGAARSLDELRRIHADLGSDAAIGVSSVCVGRRGARPRLRGGSPRAPRRRRRSCAGTVVCSATTSSARTSTFCASRMDAGAPRLDDRRGGEARRVRPRPRRGAARHARGVSRPPREHQRDRRRRSSSIRTRSASGSAGSAISPASTSAATTG